MNTTTTINIIPILDDNYAYIVENNGVTAVIDPGEAQPVIEALEQRNKKAGIILNTHHHGDHIGGNDALMARYNAVLYAPAAESSRIDHIDNTLSEGDIFKIGNAAIHVIETPGHTRGHICFYIPSIPALFSGDTLFSMGCGRLLEGSAAQMWDSLQKIKALPDDTLIYCGHEYTESNGIFCLSVAPDNTDLQIRMKNVTALRAAGKPTLPVTLATEKKTNVFLQAESAEEFAILRAKKDRS